MTKLQKLDIPDMPKAIIEGGPNNTHSIGGPISFTRNGVEFCNTSRTIVEFKNWAEVSDWWSKHPTYIRTAPKIEVETVEEYNQKNHELSFPCKMEFISPSLPFIPLG